jgi:ABC-2 type transport system permease protein
MNNFFLLTKIQFYSLFGINKALHSKDGTEKKKLIKTAFLMLGIAVLFIGMSVFYNLMFADVINTTGLSLKLLPGAMLSLGCFLTFINTIYKTNGTVFGFKDFDMIMSLPVKKTHVIASKVTFVYLLDLMTTAVMMIPAGIIYGIYAKAGVLFYVYYFISMPFVPLIPMIIGLLIGAIVTYITSRFKKSNIFSIILYIVFFAAIMFLFYGNPSDQQYTNMLTGLNRLYPLAGFYLDATCSENILYLVIFILSSVLLSIAFFYAMGINYLKINTAILTKSTGAKYDIQKTKQNSPIKAIFFKELKRFFSLPLYVMNSGIGAIMALFLGGFAIISMNGELISSLRVLIQEFPAIAYAMPIAISFIMTITTTTSCAISLEGKNMWILKSSPIKTKDILLAKLLVNYVVMIPFGLLCSLLLGISLNLGIGYHLYSLVGIILIVSFASALGLVINLKFVKLEWASEVVVIKQSAAVVIHMLLDMLYSIILIIAAYFLLYKLEQLGAMLLMMFIIISTVSVNFILFNWGEKAFNKID